MKSQTSWKRGSIRLGRPERRRVSWGEARGFVDDFRHVPIGDVQDHGNVALGDAVELPGVEQPGDLDEALDAPEVVLPNVVDKRPDVVTPFLADIRVASLDLGFGAAVEALVGVGLRGVFRRH